MAIPIVGRVFPTAAGFLDYLDDIVFTSWRPRFVTVHHCGSPDLATWERWQTRTPPVTDAQWLRNLASYYGSSPEQGGPADGPWSAGPHFMITPKNICVLSPPDKRGVHARSFNATSWGVETVGNFDREEFENPIRAMLIDALAAMHVAAGLQPSPFEMGVRGLHFHRDDPLTTKTCPGRNVQKPPLIASVQRRMLDLTPGGDHNEETTPVPVPQPPAPVTGSRTGTVTATDGLAVRTDPSTRAPKIRELAHGATVTVDVFAMNGQTKWLRIGQDEWVSARFVAGVD